MGDSGLVSVREVSNGGIYNVNDITPQGHEFLGKIRSETVD